MTIKHLKKVIGGIILIAAITTVYMYHTNVKIKNFRIGGIENLSKKKKEHHALRSSNVVITNIHMGIGSDKSIGIELACPYEDKKQYSQLIKYSSRIKSDFILTVGEDNLEQWVKERNIHAVKSTFLNIVNKYVDKPLSDIYLNQFFQE